MTAEEWETCDDPHRMLRAFRATLPRVPVSALGYTIRTPERKMQLFAVALGRGCQWLFKHDWHRLALDATEEAAECADQEGPTRLALSQLYDDMRRPNHPDNPDLDTVARQAALPHEFWEATDALLVSCVRALRTAWGNRKPPVPAQADLVREIFGNPFRPVVFAREWRTDTTLPLAWQVYESRDFSALPILADALQDAGCDSAELLAHLRDECAPHVRGCWALDRVLGKE
jgi:hypothetical protein